MNQMKTSNDDYKCLYMFLWKENRNNLPTIWYEIWWINLRNMKIKLLWLPLEDVMLFGLKWINYFEKYNF